MVNLPSGLTVAYLPFQHSSSRTREALREPVRRQACMRARAFVSPLSCATLLAEASGWLSGRVCLHKKDASGPFA